MSRTTIDFGIDLGTTNSAIAVLKGVTSEVVKNNDNSETTPSAVRIDRKNRLFVGRAAKEHYERDPANTSTEFKLRMGTADEAELFEASGTTMSPEQLSAEVLKSLKNDVAQRLNEEITAAVITVPAAFELSACEATRRAAELAGLTHAPLLQEPTAAALAYGFQSDSDNVFWMVYDFGGGTFDAAIVHLRDGEFSVVTHRGDNSLGGKFIDWRIVEDLLIPAVTRQHRVTGLARGNRRWSAAIAKLKQAAEEAKIRLSRSESAEIELELRDDQGRVFDFEYELQRRDVEKLIEPFIVRSLNLCKKALEESDLGSGDIEKVLLVGGQTLSPYLRERLADPVEGLGIPLDLDQDPVTVVARGAAIFAGAQRLDRDVPLPPPTPGQFTIALEYEPVGPDTEPFIGGRVSGTAAGATGLSGFRVEFLNREAEPPWRSGQVVLPPDGAFTATLWAEKGRTNTFDIELTDPTGVLREISPPSFDYTVGAVEKQSPLTHSIGVALENNEVEWLLERGTPLPARQKTKLRTTVAISQGHGQGILRIPVVEGENQRADRNSRIGRLEVAPDQVHRDVPEGSEVELTIEINESRLVLARAYVPVLDEEFEHPINLGVQVLPTHEGLDRDAAAETARLLQVAERAKNSGNSQATAVLQRIEDERIAEDVTSMVKAAKADTDAASTGERRLRDLKSAVDDAEAALEWDELVTEAKQLIEEVRKLANARGDAQHRRLLGEHEATISNAIESRDADLLRQRLNELRQLAFLILDAAGDLPYLLFENLQEHRHEMTDQAAASRLIAQGQQAIARHDSHALRSINRELAAMLPTPPSLSDALKSTVEKHR